MQIVTGHTGELHVTSVDDSVRNVMLGRFGEKVVLPVYEEFEARAITANIVRVYSGYGMNQGRLFRIDRNTYDEVIIENGTAGMKRADLIVARYEMNDSTGVESIALTAIRGETGNAYVDPTYNTGDLMEGDLIDDMPLYRVKINGIVIEALEPLFTIYDALGGKVDKINGKDLSTNDFTDEYKNKLDGIAAQATKVSVARGLEGGTEVGTITVNGNSTKLYAPPAAQDAASMTWVQEQIASAVDKLKRSVVANYQSSSQITRQEIINTIGRDIYARVSRGELLIDDLKDCVLIINGISFYPTLASQSSSSDRFSMRMFSISGFGSRSNDNPYLDIDVIRLWGDPRNSDNDGWGRFSWPGYDQAFSRTGWSDQTINGYTASLVLRKM